MTGEEFDRVVVGEVVRRMRGTLACKGVEYSTSNDRFHNFRQAAQLLQTTPEEALLGMMVKHVVSVVDMVHSLPLEGAGTWEMEAWWEKAGDAINYLVLLLGMVMERKGMGRGMEAGAVWRRVQEDDCC